MSNVLVVTSRGRHCVENPPEAMIFPRLVIVVRKMRLRGADELILRIFVMSAFVARPLLNCKL